MFRNTWRMTRFENVENIFKPSHPSCVPKHRIIKFRCQGITQKKKHTTFRTRQKFEIKKVLICVPCSCCMFHHISNYKTSCYTVVVFTLLIRSKYYFCHAYRLYLFTVYLTTLSQAYIILYSANWWNGWCTVNWKECGRKQAWPNFRYHPEICLEGLRITKKNISLVGARPWFNP